MGILKDLQPGEHYWRDHYAWFLEQGFRLRPRYDPGWTPSWEKDKSKIEGTTEDSQVFHHHELNDAIRLADDRHVVLKRINRAKYPEEVTILKHFSEETLASKPENHCVPVLAVLNPPDDPDYDILVLPILRDYDDPHFDTIGEAVDYIRQILEGFAFLHEHHVAHRDVRRENIMMDPQAMGHSPWHFCDPQRQPAPNYDAKVTHKYTRTERRPRYYIIDFGYATQFKPEEIPPSILPKLASDGSVPEYKNHQPCNPFPIDVYVVGNMIRMDFLDGYPKPDAEEGREEKKRSTNRDFEFLRPLIDAMIKENPNDRITMKEALSRFNDIVSKLDTSKLRSRAVLVGGRPRDEEFFEHIASTASHWYKTLRYVIRRIPPIPREPPASSTS
ncbi:other/AgaK1 protein kinase [Coprinopsis cinerea AmutBmut pab1-1]|nr:other/AgaK1 protein kinase [Coprinopsis cinerea AmutBmut pab1-1]